MAVTPPDRRRVRAGARFDCNFTLKGTDMKRVIAAVALPIVTEESSDRAS
jgi:hypothetical protein